MSDEAGRGPIPHDAGEEFLPESIVGRLRTMVLGARIIVALREGVWEMTDSQRQLLTGYVWQHEVAPHLRLVAPEKVMMLGAYCSVARDLHWIKRLMDRDEEDSTLLARVAEDLRRGVKHMENVETISPDFVDPRASPERLAEAVGRMLDDLARWSRGDSF